MVAVQAAKLTLNTPLATKINGGSTQSPVTPGGPKTPADEGIEFFETTDGLSTKVPIKIYELRLEADGGAPKSHSYIRLPPAYVPYILRVSIDAGSSAARNGIFKTNFPLDGGPFGRDRFAERRLPTDFSKPIHVDLPISHAGAFVYWVEYDSSISGERIKGQEGYFNIDPVLRIPRRLPILGDDAKPLGPAQGGGTVQKEMINLPLNGLSILTVVSKWMGTIDKWEAVFEEAQQRGYTMLHYPPLQERGSSNSPYSIRKQLQYEPSMFKEPPTEDSGRSQVEDILKTAREKYGLLSLTDVVLNHTANDSPWLVEHPEAGYSPSNTPHLAPALELDDFIIDFSRSLKEKGTSIKSQDDLDSTIDSLRALLHDRRLWEYYVLDIVQERRNIINTLTSHKAVPWSGKRISGRSAVELAETFKESGSILGLGEFAARSGVRSDAGVSAGFIQAAFPETSDPEALADSWMRVVDVLNVPLYTEWEEDTKVAVENIKNRAKYLRVEGHGPRLSEIDESHPLVEVYFTRVNAGAKTDPLVHSLANNGWIWNANPLQNFALPPSKAYLRREVIVWGDCVKLRYGSGPEANPWLWDYMKAYVTNLAATYDGFRIDNCHSTPLEVGTYMLDAARVTRPDLYVCAELFTGNEETDILFVKRLGINSLVRESYNGWDPKELSRLIYRHGVGKPIGSMDAACLTSIEQVPSPTGRGPVRTCIVTPLAGSMPHALMYDLTHDNESPLDKRSAEDALSTGALATFCYSALGSVKGFDDLYPKIIDLVNEKRQYELSGLGENSGIARVKRVLNHLHLEMVLGGYEEGHIHQENDYITVHRVQPSKQKGYILVAHTAFNKGDKGRGYVNPIKLRRAKAKYVLGATLEISSYEDRKDKEFLRGLPAKLQDIPPVHVIEGSDDEGFFSEIIVPTNFPPGSILVFETQLQDYDSELEKLCVSGAAEAFKELDLVDLNTVLHRSEAEERDATEGVYGAYHVPKHGTLVYCGLEGWMHPLRNIMKNNDLGHPLCEHLRDGVWALDYVFKRMEHQTNRLPHLARPAAWFKGRFDRIKTSVPNYLRPKYFALVIFTAYKAARRAVVEQCSEFILSGHDFTHDLALCAVQMYGLVNSASLDPAKPTPSLAAGLPHFATSWARCWGRDVFISLRGLFLTTGNFDGAKKHILSFASTLKHGLIPNLLDSVRNPRYNSRDSPWWMLQNIQDYVMLAPNGLALLSEPVKRRFPKDDTWVPWNDPKAYAYSSTVAEIIQEILERHAQGIHFREHNAGANLDMQMSDAGFTIDIEVDWSTGFIHGGNRYNCGTWMDKMGESVKAGTKGVPGTPRDGAPVEITGLLASTLRWLDQLSQKGQFPFKGVNAKVNHKETFITYGEWFDLLRASFERYYYIPSDPTEDQGFKVVTSLINRRGIYKDVYGSGPGREWSDYQLRPNFPIAMVVAPELFNEEHAVHALQVVDKVLRGPLGLKTLDSGDLQYRPVYDNSNDSADAAIAKGLNYHNGPEWGWPLGYFLRAYFYFDTRAGSGKGDPNTTLHHLHHLLLPARHHIQSDPWAGLPELTNEKGAYCRDSCPTQAWSASTILDFLEEVHRFNALA